MDELNHTPETVQPAPDSVGAAYTPAAQPQAPAAQPQMPAAQPQTPAAQPQAPAAQFQTPAATPVQPTPAKPKKSKKGLIIGLSIGGGAALLVILAVIVTVIIFFNTASQPLLPDEQADYIDVVTANYYSGVVEPQETSTVQRDAERTVKEIYVKVGDTVKKGDKLFTYDVAESELKLRQAKLELDGINNEITGYTNQINDLTRQRAKAPEDQQLDYTVQIQELESNQKQAQLNLRMKQVEIDNLQKALENAEVHAPIDGIVKQINNSPTADANNFITILMTGSYRVKGTVDELNVGNLYEGMPVVIRSRVDAAQTWTGTITKIDTEDTSSNNNTNDMFDGAQTGEKATKYTFYTTLDSSDNLLLGQHVYIEPQIDAPLMDGDMEAIDYAVDDSVAE